MQPHILAKELIKMNIAHGFIHWIFAYLTNRTQSVYLDRHCCSDVIATNTGAPRGTMLAPFITTPCTADCRTHDINYPFIKFADDKAMIGLIHNNDDLRSFVDYCDTNYLQLNISKTKEQFVDFCQTASPPPAILIKRVSSYKYLGVHLNDCLILQ